MHLHITNTLIPKSAAKPHTNSSLRLGLRSEQFGHGACFLSCSPATRCLQLTKNTLISNDKNRQSHKMAAGDKQKRELKLVFVRDNHKSVI
jgi:hypothetical protein